MSLSHRRSEFVLLIAAGLLWGCGSSPPTPSSTQVRAPASPAAPTPSGGPIEPGVTDGDANEDGDPPGLDEGDPLLNAVVVTVSDRVRVRSEPRVSDDSIRYEPLLPLGTSLYVLDGPVSASGYTWYKVASVSLGLIAPGVCGADQGPCDGINYGWVAAAGRDGEPWLAAGRADCPPVPTDVPALVSLPLGARLACFSRMPITVQARLIECNCDVDGGGYEPNWFTDDQPLLLVEPSETHPPADYEDWLIVRFDPAGRYPEALPVGDIVEVTGMFDHPAALNCLFQDVPVETAGPPAPTSNCRFMFATTSLVAVQPSGTGPRRSSVGRRASRVTT